MKSDRRAEFLGLRPRQMANEANGIADYEETKVDRLRNISMSRVDNIDEFNKLFDAAVKRQQEAKKSQTGERISKEEKVGVIKDDAFADLDAEFGF